MKSPTKYCTCCHSKEWKILYKLSEFNIVQCCSCSLIFRDIRLDSNSAEELYSEKYFKTEHIGYFFGYPMEKAELINNRLNLVESYLPNKGEMLDVGCAIGTFLKKSRVNGWKVQGVEISQFASKFARDEYNLDVFSGEFEKINFNGKKYDVITMWDVIDHSEDPFTFVNKAVSLLKDNGYLFIETQMVDSLVYRSSKYLYNLSFGLIKSPVAKGHPIHHSTFFSQETLRREMETLSLKVMDIVKSEYPSKFFPGSILFKTIFRLVCKLGSFFNMPLQVIFILQKK